MNFEAALQLVLDIAVRNRCSQKDLPKALICITDMEFNAANRNGRATFMEYAREMYARAGYIVPVLVFWNVNSRNDVFHADQNDKGVIMVAGQSASTFENLIRCINGKKILSARDFMNAVLNGERYQMIRLPE